MRLPLVFILSLLGSSVGAADTLAAAVDLVPRVSAPDTAALDLTPTWIAGGKSTVLPGWGQFQTGHDIRGSILMVFDVWLYGDAAFRTWSAIPKLRDKAAVLTQRTSVFADSVRARGDTTRPGFLLANLRTDSAGLKILQDSASLMRGRARVSADYRNGELAWAMGMHAYAIADAAEDAWLASGGKRPVTEMSSAIWRSALIPGWGQIYNAHYSKAALLYMGIAGSLTSFFSRQQMVEFWQSETQLAIADGRSTTTTVQQTEFFRKRRNQYVWGMGLVYVYQILDAAVDARLSRFGRPFPLALEPRFDQPGLVASLRF